MPTTISSNHETTTLDLGGTGPCNATLRGENEELIDFFGSETVANGSEQMREITSYDTFWAMGDQRQGKSGSIRIKESQRDGFYDKVASRAGLCRVP